MAPGRRAGRGRRCARCCARAGHELWTPTYTGLGERAHLANAEVSLDTHIRDVVAAIEMENLDDLILIGHSYGGMVATGVADRARARIAQLVYLDAFAPTDGQAIFDLVPPDIAEKMRAGAAASPSGYGVPPNPMPSDTARRTSNGRRRGACRSRSRRSRRR